MRFRLYEGQPVNDVLTTNYTLLLEVMEQARTESNDTRRRKKESGGNRTYANRSTSCSSSRTKWSKLNRLYNSNGCQGIVLEIVVITSLLRSWVRQDDSYHLLVKIINRNS